MTPGSAQTTWKTSRRHLRERQWERAWAAPARLTGSGPEGGSLRCRMPARSLCGMLMVSLCRYFRFVVQTSERQLCVFNETGHGGSGLSEDAVPARLETVVNIICALAAGLVGRTGLKALLACGKDTQITLLAVSKLFNAVQELVHCVLSSQFQRKERRTRNVRTGPGTLFAGPI